MKSLRILPALALTLTLLSACNDPAAVEGPTQGTAGFDRATLLEIQQPPLDRLEPAVREQLTIAVAEVEELRARAEVEDATLGQAYGDLGRSYHAYEFFDAARVAYLNATLLAPQHPHWPYYLGHAYRSMNQLEDSVQAFDRALQLAPSTVPVFVNAAQVRRELGRLDEAEELARRALTKEPEAPGALLLLAELATDREDHNQAVELYETLLRIQPAADRLYVPLATAYRALGETGRADKLLTRRGDTPVRTADLLLDSLAQLKTGARFDLTVGNAAYQRGDLTTAESAFRKALERDPDDVEARMNLAATLLRAGDPKASTEVYRQALEIDPGNRQVHFSLGVVAARSEDDEAAIRHYLDALEIDPTFRDARFNLGNALRRQGQCGEAVDHYRRLIEADGGDGSARLAEAACLVDLERFVDARGRLKEALQALPRSRAIANAGARLLATAPDAEARDGRQAVEIARRLLQLDPRPEYSETLAMALAEVGEFEEALQIQRSLLESAERRSLSNLVPRLRRNLERYEEGQPCREPALG